MPPTKPPHIPTILAGVVGPGPSVQNSMAHYARTARISRSRKTIPSPLARSSHHRARVRPLGSSRTLAPKFSKLHVVAEGVGS
jgi:hypothetical protein